MNDQDYELISQYIDGELAADEARALRRRLLTETGLRAAYDRMRRADNEIRGAFSGDWTRQVPERVSALLEKDSAGGGVERAGQRRGAWGLAVAASVLAAAGLLLNPDWRATDTDTGDTALAAVLESTASGSPEWQDLADGSQARPVLSFAHVDGSWCREYLLSRDGATYRGVACRQDGRWVTGILEAQAAAGGTTEYRPAGADVADAVAVFITRYGAGIPLSRGEEAELIIRQWRQEQ